MGLGAYPASGENWLGMLGMHGTFTANYGDGQGRPDRRHRRPLRRPHHRQARRVRPARQGHPHRHRPGRDLQERRRPHPDRRRRQAGAAEADPRVPGAADRLLPARRLVEPAPRLAAGAPALLRARQGRRDQAAVHGRGDAPGDPGRRDRHLRRRPAPDVGGAVLRLRQAAPLDQLRRPRHDGLRPALGGRRQGRLPRRARRLPRRRRQPDHERAGAGDLRHRRDPGQGLPHEQRLHGHGPPVAGAVLGPPLQLGRDGRQPRLGEAGRGLRRHRPALRELRRPRGDDGQGAGDRRPGPARRPRRPGGELLPDDPAGRSRPRHGRGAAGGLDGA